MKNTFIFWIALACIVLFIAGYAVSKRRREAFRRFARQRGFAFSARDSSGIERKFEKFHLFNQGRGKKIHNVVHGQYEGLSIWLFDYRFGEDQFGGEEEQSRHVFQQTVMVVQSGDCNFTGFHLFPKNIVHRVANLISKKDIPFLSHKNFSSMYAVRGDDEGAVRKIMDDRVMDHFAGHTGMTVEGSGESFLMYRFATLVRGDKLYSFMDEGLEVFRLLNRR